MDFIDFDLIAIVGVRIYDVLLVLMCLITGQWIREEARIAGWTLLTRRVVTAIAWALALSSVGGFVSDTLWLELAALLAVLATFFASGAIITAIAEHPIVRPTGHPGAAAEGEMTSERAQQIRVAGRLMAFAAGVVLGGSAFFGRSLPLGADIVLLGWLASRRPIPAVWISLLGVAVGLVGGGLVTIDPAPVTIGLLAAGVAVLALILRRGAEGADANRALSTPRA